MLKKLNYYDVKKFVSKEDEIACNEAWEKEIELSVDENGRVYDESDRYIADVILLEENEDY